MIEKLLLTDWKAILQDEWSKNYFKNLEIFIESEYKNFKCYPPKSFIFEALNRCSFHDVKVVIIGQDPYHGFGQANGLCFSVSDGVAIPPSLRNIFRELQDDLNIPLPISGNLERWANQGVLLLNAVLTVRDGEAGSHQNQGWEKFTDVIIEKISNSKEGVLFLLWGSFAKKKGAKIDRKKHFVFESGHPSPLSANRGFWFGNKHFSVTNTALIKRNKLPINW